MLIRRMSSRSEFSENDTMQRKLHFFIFRNLFCHPARRVIQWRAAEQFPCGIPAEPFLPCRRHDHRQSASWKDGNDFLPQAGTVRAGARSDGRERMCHGLWSALMHGETDLPAEERIRVWRQSGSDPHSSDPDLRSGNMADWKHSQTQSIVLQKSIQDRVYKICFRNIQKKI